MQTMTRVQTQIYSRRVKTEEDKKALRSQIQLKQALDKTKVRNTICSSYKYVCCLNLKKISGVLSESDSVFVSRLVKAGIIATSPRSRWKPRSP
jgi:hypothetical protein